MVKTLNTVNCDVMVNPRLVDGQHQIFICGDDRGAKEVVTQLLEHAFGEDEPALLGLRLQDLENQLLFPHPGRAGDVQVLADLGVVVLDRARRMDDRPGGGALLRAEVRAASAVPLRT